MMVRKVTLVKYWLKPARSAPSESCEKLKDRLTAGKWWPLADLELVFPLAVGRTGAVSSPSRKEPWALALLWLWVQKHIPLSFMLNLQEDLEAPCQLSDPRDTSSHEWLHM